MKQRIFRNAAGRGSFFLVASALLMQAAAPAQSISVHYKESSTHGFLVIRSQEGGVLGSGELTELEHGDRVKARLVLRFKDGSLDDETTVYSQGGAFQLVSDHHVQRGPFFAHALDTSINMGAQQVTVASEKAGAGNTETSSLKMPAELSNGMLLSIVKNLQASEPEVDLPYLAFSPKPRLVTFAISRDGQESFRIAGHAFRTDRYLLRVKLGGVAGAVAPLLGKQPTDAQLWVATGDVPVVVRLDTALCEGGPIVSLQLTGPNW